MEFRKDHGPHFGFVLPGLIAGLRPVTGSRMPGCKKVRSSRRTYPLGRTLAAYPGSCCKSDNIYLQHASARYINPLDKAIQSMFKTLDERNHTLQPQASGSH